MTPLYGRTSPVPTLFGSVSGRMDGGSSGSELEVVAGGVLELVDLITNADEEVRGTAESKPKRPVGRPPTTGEGVGALRYKVRLKELQRKYEEVSAERDILLKKFSSTFETTAGGVKSARSLMVDFEDYSSTYLANDIEDQMSGVDLVAEKSSNLKGTYKRTLRTVAHRAVAAARLLAMRVSASGEGSLLGPTSAEVEQLRRGIKIRVDREEEARRRILKLENEVEDLRVAALRAPITGSLEQEEQLMEVEEEAIDPAPLQKLRVRKRRAESGRRPDGQKTDWLAEQMTHMEERLVFLATQICESLGPASTGDRVEKRRKGRPCPPSGEGSGGAPPLSASVPDHSASMPEAWSSVVRRRGRKKSAGILARARIPGEEASSAPGPSIRKRGGGGSPGRGGPRWVVLPRSSWNPPLLLTSQRGWKIGGGPKRLDRRRS